VCIDWLVDVANSGHEDRPTRVNYVRLFLSVPSYTLYRLTESSCMPSFHSHCIVGGVIGVGIATIGGDGVVWGWKGVAQVFAAWGIAPAVAGAFAAIIFLLTKYLVLERKNPLRAGFIAIPIYFGITSGILTMLVVWKGGESAISNIFRART
jgi:sodium-dependent phosphate transporter